MIKFSFNSRNRRTNTFFPDTPFETAETQIRVRETGTGEWFIVKGSAMNVPDTNRVVHSFNVEGLTPDSSYEFQTSVPTLSVYLSWAGDPSTSMVVYFQSQKPFTKRYVGGFYENDTYKFKTVPESLTETFKVAQVSDTHGGGEVIAEAFKNIGQHDARAIIHSGDMATGNGGEATPTTWYGLFDALQNAVDTTGHIIPILPNIGNHETWGGSSGVQYGNNDTGIKPNFETGERGDAEWYYCFFPLFPTLTGYGQVTFGDYLSVWQIDPGISTRVDQGQDEWLANTLHSNADIPNKLLSVHYSPYPAGRRPIYSYNVAVRNTLVPIWEEYKPVILTGHDHVWSVSPFIKGGEESNDGAIYIGSGTVGSMVQSGRNPNTKWWIDDSIGSSWEKYDFEEAGGAEERDDHPDDGKEFDWELGSHYWLIKCNYENKTLEAFNAYNNKFYEKTINN